jgi:predicted transglutaminase-like cysteine proteinase
MEVVGDSRLPKKRFGADSVNDLIFWGLHLCVVAISLGVVWSKIDSTNRALLKVVAVQDRELVLVQEQTIAARHQAESAMVSQAQADEATRMTKDTLQNVLASQAEMRETNLTSMGQLLGATKDIQNSIEATLGQIQRINAQLAGTAEEKTQQAKQAEDQAALAKQKASAAGNALAAKRRQLRRAGQYITQQNKRNIFQRLLNTH